VADVAGGRHQIERHHVSDRVRRRQPLSLGAIRGTLTATVVTTGAIVPAAFTTLVNLTGS
jgi:hypothetical protein